MNNCTFIGRLGKDAELKELGEGKKVLNFSIAVDDGKDKPPVWIDCARWSEKTGILPYLKKGTQVAVSGNIGLRKWETGSTITLRVGDIRLLGERHADNPLAGEWKANTQTTGNVQTEPIDDLPF